MIIGGKTVTKESQTLIVAEVGINHDGILEKAFELIDMAAEAGADVAKFQLFTAKRMYPPKAGIRTLANGTKRAIYDVIKETEVPYEWIPALMSKCKERGLGFLCTTCDEDSTDALIRNNVDAFKIASSELAHYPLLRYCAETGRSMIISEGAATLGEIERAINTIKDTGNNSIALLHCTKEYPADLKDCNIRLIETYQTLFPDIITGFSDHTLDPSHAPLQAIKKGAKIIEKHITLDKTAPGADHIFALNYEDLKKLVKDIRHYEKNLSLIPDDPVVLGKPNKTVLEREKDSRSFTHRAVFAAAPIKKGDVLCRENLDVLRSAYYKAELDAEFIDLLIAKKVKANRDIEEGTPILWGDVLSI